MSPGERASTSPGERASTSPGERASTSPEEASMSPGERASMSPGTAGAAPARTRERLWRFCNFLMSLFFAMAAYVQINDPDAEIWIVVYTFPAALTFLVGINADITGHLIWRTLADLQCAACVLGTGSLAGYLFIYRKKSLLHEEEGRELCGLGIIAVWMLLCRKSEKQAVGAIRLPLACI
ncbi:transmembrane protein 220 isoform X2 [Ascaphus truei]|uniref:transmembrane protein 220 isoform X2 n=1 Tax=Ascaphus truei TaxID=8439 RepID=UPI003F596FE3